MLLLLKGKMSIDQDDSPHFSSEVSANVGAFNELDHVRALVNQSLDSKL